MFSFFQKIRESLNDWDQRYCTNRELENNMLLIYDDEFVVVSTKRKRLYWERHSHSIYSHENREIHRIYEYILNGNKVYVKMIQDSTDFFSPKREKEYRIKNWEVFVDWIYKNYNRLPSSQKEWTLEEEVNSYRKLCLFNPLCDMKVQMFILSKCLNKNELRNAIQEKIKLMYEWKEKYKIMTSSLWLTDIEDWTHAKREAEKIWKYNNYREWTDSICEKCWCSRGELTYKFDDTIKEIQSYLK